MPRTTRTFVALSIPADRAAKLARLQGLIAPEFPPARWVEPGQFHITLAFLGEVEDVDLLPICRTCSAVAARAAPFELRLEALGVFPDADRPRVAWVGLTGPGLEPLAALQRDVATSLAAIGHPPEDDRFHPHVTLGRLKVARDAPVDVGPILRHYRTWSPGSIDVAELITFGSTLTPEGPSYAPLAQATLGGETRRGRT